MMYEVGYLIVPWTLFGIALIAVAKLWHMCRVLNRSKGSAQAELKKLKDAIFIALKDGRTDNAQHWVLVAEQNERYNHSIKSIEKLVANALESAAAHREAVRLLQVAEAELAKYRPNRDKKGHFIPKKKVEKPSAKSTKGH